MSSVRPLLSGPGGSLWASGSQQGLLLSSGRFKAAANEESRLTANAHSCPGGLDLVILAYLSMCKILQATWLPQGQLQSAAASCLSRPERAGRCTKVACTAH